MTTLKKIKEVAIILKPSSISLFKKIVPNLIKKLQTKGISASFCENEKKRLNKIHRWVEKEGRCLYRNLSELEFLYLQSNKFVGDISSIIGDLKKLKHSNFDNNQFSN